MMMMMMMMMMKITLYAAIIETLLMTLVRSCHTRLPYITAHRHTLLLYR